MGVHAFPEAQPGELPGDEGAVVELLGVGEDEGAVLEDEAGGPGEAGEGEE